MRSIRCALGIHDMQFVQDTPQRRNYICVRCGYLRLTESIRWTPGELVQHGQPLEKRETRHRIDPSDLHRLG